MIYVAFVIIAFIIMGVIGYIVGIYNALIRANHNVDKSWSNINILLKQRHDELPKLIDTCKAFMKHERSLLEDLTRARTAFLNAPTIEKKTEAENQLARGLKSVFAVAENYPDLKSNQNFMQLQNRISGLENEISDRREFFNESVNIFNIRIEQFPNFIVAQRMQYAKKPLLDISNKEMEDVKIKFS
jgi:LemA protein